MLAKPDVIYETESEEKKEMCRKLYNKFAENYYICLNKNEGLIVTEMGGGKECNKEGIKISPKQRRGKILSIFKIASSFKPNAAPDLEMKLIMNDILQGFSIFKIEDNEIIQINYKYQD